MHITGRSMVVRQCPITKAILMYGTAHVRQVFHQSMRLLCCIGVKHPSCLSPVFLLGNH